MTSLWLSVTNGVVFTLTCTSTKTSYFSCAKKLSYSTHVPLQLTMSLSYSALNTLSLIYENTMGLRDPEHPFWGYSITHQLLVAMIDLHNKFEASSSPSFKRQDVTSKFIKVSCYPGQWLCLFESRLSPTGLDMSWAIYVTNLSFTNWPQQKQLLSTMLKWTTNL